MDVFILSKTHMKGKCCIGGITKNGEYVRLLTSSGDNQPEDTELNPKQLWDMEFVKRQNVTPPHVEDVLIQSKVFKGTLKKEVKVGDYIKRMNPPIWVGGPNVLFDNAIKWTDKGSGYIDKNNIPAHSVGFWISDKDLIKNISFDKIRYNYRGADGLRSIPYVGFDDSVDIIPAGVLIRLSLARWWDTKGTTELRCPLQVSGWYDLD